MKVVVLCGSPRANGNTEIMANEFKRGAEEAGNEVALINLRGKKIAGCLACEYCFSHDGECVQKDDMAEILKELDQADAVVFASPIYWFDISAQLKTVIDRMYARAKKGFHFNKTALLLDSASDGVYDAAITQYKAMTGYLRWEDLGIITVPGMSSKGAMKDSPAMDEVYKLGLSLKAG